MHTTRRALLAPATAVAAAAVAAVLAAGSPAGAAGFGVSYSTAGAGNTAGLAPGSNHPGALLHVSNVGAGSYAMITVTGIAPGSVAPTQAPSFTASSPTGYQAGSGDPRMEIQPSGKTDSVANDITVYPAAMDGRATGACFGTAAVIGGVCYFQNNTGEPTWAAAAAYLNANGGVQQAYLVQDASSTIIQGSPYDVTIAPMSWAGQVLLPGAVANHVAAQDQCGPYTNRLWILRNLAGVTVTVKVFDRLNDGALVAAGSAVVPPAGAEFRTHRGGGGVQERYGNGLGGFTRANYPVTTTLACPS